MASIEMFYGPTHLYFERLNFIWFVYLQNVLSKSVLSKIQRMTLLIVWVVTLPIFFLAIPFCHLFVINLLSNLKIFEISEFLEFFKF